MREAQIQCYFHRCNYGIVNGNDWWISVRASSMAVMQVGNVREENVLYAIIWLNASTPLISGTLSVQPLHVTQILGPFINLIYCSCRKANPFPYVPENPSAVCRVGRNTMWWFGVAVTALHPQKKRKVDACVRLLYIHLYSPNKVAIYIMNG